MPAMTEQKEKMCPGLWWRHTSHGPSTSGPVTREEEPTPYVQTLSFLLLVSCLQLLEDYDSKETRLGVVNVQYTDDVL